MQLLFMEGLITQVIVIVAVLAIFYGGVYIRSFFDEKSSRRLSRNQIIVSALVVFIFGGIPLCQVVYETLRNATSLFTVLGTFVPVFAAGFTAREEIKKHVPAAVQPKAA